MHIGGINEAKWTHITYRSLGTWSGKVSELDNWTREQSSMTALIAGPRPYLDQDEGMAARTGRWAGAAAH